MSARVSLGAGISSSFQPLRNLPQSLIPPPSRSVAKDRGVSHFTELDACLSATSLDGVIVASPNHLHLAHGLACLNAGIPVLIEKPLADTAAAGNELVDRSRETGVPILVGHHRRHSPLIAAAKQVVREGRLGKIVAVNGMFWLHKPADYFDTSWRTLPGGGPTFINLIHDIDLLQYLCNPIVSVQDSEANGVRGLQVEDTSAIILTFENGALGTVTVSDTVSAPWSWELTAGENPVYPKTDQSCYTIGGTAGSLSLPDLRVWSHPEEQSWWTPIDADQVQAEPCDPVEAQLRHFLCVIADQTTPVVTAEDGLRNIEVLDAIKSAAQSGKITRVRNLD